jgi:hypothetical protein
MRVARIDDLWLYDIQLFTFDRVPSLQATGMGAAFGTAKAGIGIAGIGTYRPDLIMKVDILDRVL